MKAAQFLYHAPSSVDEAVGILSEVGDDAKLLAGGQSLVPILALRLTRFGHLVDLNRVAELQFIAAEDESLVLGSMTRQSTAEHSDVVSSLAPLVSRALPHIGHFQIRNRGTIGGSICHADPASELPAVALALDAEIEVIGRLGVRRVPASEFFVSTWETALAPDEIAVSIRFPRARARSGFGFEEVAWRSGDFAIAGVACAVVDRGAVGRAGIAFMGMGATPERASAAEAAVAGMAPREVDLASVAALATSSLSPADDVHASSDYRKKVAAALLVRALGAALEEASHG